MGILEAFKKKKEKEESDFISWAYSKADEMQPGQIGKLLEYIFRLYSEAPGAGILIKRLIEKISKLIGHTEPVKDYKLFLEQVFSKVNFEEQKAIFVTACFDIWKISTFSAAALIVEIEKVLAECRQLPEFINAGKKEV